MSNMISSFWVGYKSYMKIGLLSMAVSAILFSFLGLALKYGDQLFYISIKTRNILVISTASICFFYKSFLMKKLTLRYSASAAQSIDLILYGLFLTVSTFAVFFAMQ